MPGFLAQEIATNDDVEPITRYDDNTIYRRSIIKQSTNEETRPITETISNRTPSRPCPHVRFPRWCLIPLLLLGLALFAAILGVGIGLGGRHKSLFESCGANSICMNNAACTNGLCICSSGYFYDSTTGLCISQVGIGRSCAATSNCITNAYCTNGLCECNSSYYPSPTLGNCQLLKTYTTSCQYDIECAFTFECLNGACACNSSKFYSTQTGLCQKLGLPNEDSCYADYNCISTAVCIGGLCQCPTDFFYQVLTNTCDRKVRIGGFCTQSYQCITNANCTSLQTCQCNNGTQYSIQTGQCITPISYGQACVQTADCVINLICVSSICQCGTNQQYYNPSNTTCLNKATISQACSAFGPYCDDVRLLTCSASGNCTCPTNYYYSLITARCEASKFPGVSCSSSAECIVNSICVALSMRCSCNIPGYYFNTSSAQCVAQLSYLSSCTETEQCFFSTPISSVCTNNICSCPSTAYYNYTQCAARVSYTVGCNGVSGPYCLTTVGLTCSTVTNLCVCTNSPSYYWNGSICLPTVKLSQSCTTNASCPTNAICSGGICICNATSYYFNATINSCVAYSTYGQTCTTNILATTECASTLVCSSSGVCGCSTYQYYNLGTSTCLNKTGNGGSCTTSLCNDLVGLVCSGGTCTCASGSYLNTSICSTQSDVGKSCSASSQCQSPLICASPNNICNCNGSYYLDLVTVACLSKKATGTGCTYPFECLNTCTTSVCT